MELTEHCCKRCGGELKLAGNGKSYACKYCGSTYESGVAEKHTQSMKELFNSAKLEMVNNLRRNLYDAIHADYISSKAVRQYCVELKKYLPNDFSANFYEIAAGSNVRHITQAIREINVEQHYDEMEDVVQFLINSIDSDKDYLLELNNLIERAFKGRDLRTYNRYETELSKQAKEVDAGVYETKLPRDAFIVYSSKDMVHVSELVEELENQNIKCFVAARNLRHGSGSVENYNNALKEAMDNCACVVFVSSTNSRNLGCDALKIELPYVKEEDIANAPPGLKRQAYAKMDARYKKPRVEYRIEESRKRTAADDLVDEFFDGWERVYAPKDVARRIAHIKTEIPASSAQHGAVEEDNQTYGVRLVTIGGKRRNTIDLIGSITGFNQDMSNKLALSLPAEIKTGLTKERANSICQNFAKHGSKAEVFLVDADDVSAGGRTAAIHRVELEEQKKQQQAQLDLEREKLDFERERAAFEHEKAQRELELQRAQFERERRFQEQQVAQSQIQNERNMSVRQTSYRTPQSKYGYNDPTALLQSLEAEKEQLINQLQSEEINASRLENPVVTIGMAIVSIILMVIAVAAFIGTRVGGGGLFLCVLAALVPGFLHIRFSISVLDRVDKKPSLLFFDLAFFMVSAGLMVWAIVICVKHIAAGYYFRVWTMRRQLQSVERRIRKTMSIINRRYMR